MSTNTSCPSSPAQRARRGGEFYTPRLRGQAAGRDAAALAGPRLRPLLRFLRYVRAVGGSSSGLTPAATAAADRPRADISIYGQESNYTTWRLAKMNLAIRGIEGQIAQGDSFHNDRHPDLKADFILANPPFNVSDWGGERLTDDQRWQYGVPPKGNANFAWVQHMVHHLSPNRRGWLRAGQRLHVVKPVGRGETSAGPWSKPTWWTAWWPCRDSSSTPPKSLPASGF